MDISKAFTMYILSIFSDPDTPLLISALKTMKELRLAALRFFIKEFPDDRLDFTVFINRYDGEGGVKSEKVNCMIWLDDCNGEVEVKYCEDYGGGMTRHIDMNGEEIMFGDDTDGGIYQKVKE